MENTMDIKPKMLIFKALGGWDANLATNGKTMKQAQKIEE